VSDKGFVFLIHILMILLGRGRMNYINICFSCDIFFLLLLIRLQVVFKEQFLGYIMYL
jgi:hypothetical protein